MKIGAKIAHFGTTAGDDEVSRTITRMNREQRSGGTAARSSRLGKRHGRDLRHVGVVEVGDELGDHQQHQHQPAQAGERFGDRRDDVVGAGEGLRADAVADARRPGRRAAMMKSRLSMKGVAPMMSPVAGSRSGAPGGSVASSTMTSRPRDPKSAKRRPSRRGFGDTRRRHHRWLDHPRLSSPRLMRWLSALSALLATAIAIAGDAKSW